MPDKNFIQSTRFLYLLSFIEGASVMAAELLGAKMLAPFFGSSLYVWASVMAITLGGLALGYFTGGFLSAKHKTSNLLFYIIILAAVFTAVMPYSSKLIMHLISGNDLLVSIVISTLLFLLPPVFLMGMVSPLIIERLSFAGHNAGKVSGSIYAISTLGGIIATFLMGFYIIPQFGLTQPAYLVACLLAILPILAIVKNKKAVLFTVGFFLLLGEYVYTPIKAQSDIKILYQSEGILGQIMVADYPVYNSEYQIDYYIRMMLFNRVIQTFENKNDSANPYFPYVTILVNETTHLQKKGKALLLGLGGGCVANELVKNNFEVDAVELDERVCQAAKTYFDLDASVNLIIDDARHYIRNSTTQYDVIIFDIFKGEENPAHVLTQESLEEVKKQLSPNGLLVVNGYGFRTGAKSQGVRAIVKTIQAANFTTHIIPSSVKEEEGNLLIFAKKEGFNTMHQEFVFSAKELQNSPILCDDVPALEHLNKEAVIAWRSAYIHTAIKDFNSRNIPLFN